MTPEFLGDEDGEVLPVPVPPALEPPEVAVAPPWAVAVGIPPVKPGQTLSVGRRVVNPLRDEIAANVAISNFGHAPNYL